DWDALEEKELRQKENELRELWQIDLVDDRRIKNLWEQIILEGGLEEVAHPLYLEAIAEVASIVDSEVGQLMGTALRHLPLEEQAVYAGDLQARRKAVDALLNVYLHETGLLGPIRENNLIHIIIPHDKNKCN
ncbi:MAG: hypothetical protein R6V02_01285, partial [Candidatus Aminicenantes bacterium]